MTDRLGSASNGQKILLTQAMYMCDRTHRQYEIHRIYPRRSTLVFAPGERALAASGWLAIVAHRAVYSRKLLGVRARRGPRQLCVLRAQRKRTFLCLRAPGIGSAGPTGGGQRPKARKADARSWATLYRSFKGETSSRGFWEKEASEMITVRYQQRSIYEPLAVNLMPDYQELLWEGWLLKVDKFLEDEDLLKMVREALEKRHANSRTRGRLGTPAEVVLRLMALKHLRNWSYQTLEREVRANVVYREFTRIRGEKVPDCKTMVRWGKALGPKVTRAIHERVVALGRKQGVMSGRKLRVDTTVAETDIHYPTDSGLLGDAVRVLTRTMKQIERQAGDVGTRLRDRTRSVKYRLIEIGRSAMRQSEGAVARRTEAYRKLMATTNKVMGQAKCFSEEIATGVKQASTPLGQVLIEAWGKSLDEMSGLAARVLKQTQARVLEGNSHYEDKLYS